MIQYFYKYEKEQDCKTEDLFENDDFVIIMTTTFKNNKPEIILEKAIKDSVGDIIEFIRI